MLYSIPSLKKHFIYRIIPVELFSSKIQLIVVISFIQRYIPCPFVDTGGRNGFCNGNVSITTFGKTVTDYVAVPSLVVAPCKTFTPEFQFAIVHNFIPESFATLVSSVFRITSGSGIQFYQCGTSSSLVIQEIISLCLYQYHFR